MSADPDSQLRLRTIDGLEEMAEVRLPHPVLAIGVFDGLHLGHQAILRVVVERARQLDGTAMLLTFHPHPQKVISSGDAPLLLQTREQKEELLDQIGIQIMLQLPFTRRLSLYSPQEFAERILYRNGFREIHVGSNFRFGHRRSGTFATLQELGERYGFEVRETGAVLHEGERVSSTQIRSLLMGGDPEKAALLLGRPYQIRGTVVRGRRLGGQLGFPTANLAPQNELIPANGVYVTMAHVNGESRPSVSNIGFRPTVDRRPPPSATVETHILDFQEDLYGKPIALDFLARIRDEKKFSGLDALKTQIARDCETARAFFEPSGSLSQT